MSATSSKLNRRKIRRAIGEQAADALLEADLRALDIDRFLLLRHSLWRRLKWLVTGKF